MKKWIVLTTLLISACTPQVTVTSKVTVTSTPLPTETPIPTPTLHLAFIELQKKIAVSGGNFSLTADGVIQDNGAPVQGLSVSPDGKMTLIVEGEQIPIDPEKVTFDEENGFQPEGYVQNENGDWVVWVPAPEEIWTQKVVEWGLNPDDYSVKYDVEGKTVEVKKSTQEIVYWDGYWNLEVMRKMILETNLESKKCQPTRWKGTKGQSIPPTEDKDLWWELFMKPFGKSVTLEKIKLGIHKKYPHSWMDYLGGANNCWAVVLTEKLFQHPEDVEETLIFWYVVVDDPIRDLKHEFVFSPKVKKILLQE